MLRETTILLYELAGPALIVPSHTGVRYLNQTGGHSCHQMELEGYLVPIAGARIELVEQLTAHFTGPRWGGWCSRGIDDETADEIDRLLAEFARRDEITVDRDKLGECCESWIHVRIQGPLLSLVENPGATTAILTWPNSD
jgi:hypothetical protein